MITNLHKTTLAVQESRQNIGASIAGSRWQRIRGILAIDPTLREGIVIHPSFWVHTFLLQLPIDIFFFDIKGVIIKEVPRLLPKRLLFGPKRSAFVLEIYSHHGSLCEWEVGMQLREEALQGIVTISNE